MGKSANQNSKSNSQPNPLHQRRAILQGGALLLTPNFWLPMDSKSSANCTTIGEMDSEDFKASIQIGMVTDLHYADKPSAGSRHYRETLGKLSAASREFSHKSLDLIVELGDFIDAADSVAEELKYLKRINRDFSSISTKRHYVLGNHCVHTLKKQEFLDTVEQKKSFYSFDEGGIHFVVLDSCFRSDGKPYERKNFMWTDPNIPEFEMEWLQEDLVQNTLPVVVFAHQRLDRKTNYSVKNSEQIRAVLEKSNRVVAVFQGHSHQNDYQLINKIHYCTLVAMVEGPQQTNNAFSKLKVAENGSILVEGFFQQKNHNWRQN